MSDQEIQNVQRIPLRGDLRIIRRDAQTHDIISVWENKNVITFGAVTSLVYLMAPNVALGVNVQLYNQLKSMRFGTDNTAPLRTDTDLGAEAVVGGNFVRKELFDGNRIIGAAGTVEFTAQLAAGEGNGVTYREAALFTRGDADDPLVTTPGTDSMFSRQVYPDQAKTPLVVLDYRWRITFTV